VPAREICEGGGKSTLGEAQKEEKMSFFADRSLLVINILQKLKL
jgi:hypothetical protein